MSLSCLRPARPFRPAVKLFLAGMFFPCLLAMLPPPPLVAEEFRFSAADGADKINAAFGQASPGDRILLKRGDTFTGPLVCKARGSKDNPVILGAWGEGADPVLADLVGILAWEPAGKNLWKTVLPRPKGQRKHVPAGLWRGDTALALGREPERTEPWDGYRVIGKGASKQSITPPGLDQRVDWTGSEVVMRTRRWILDRMTVRTVVDGRMIFREKLGGDYLPYDSFGFFIQNHPACLDQEGEWCFVSERREILLFSAERPGSGEYRYTTLQTLLDLRESAWLEVENLDLKGSNETTIRVDDSLDLTLRGCRISLAGRNALQGYDTSGFTLESSTIDRVQNNAVDLGKATNLKILGNTISNTALLAGMGQSGDGQYNALQVNGDGILVENNLITNTGYLPISFGGDRVMIRHNVVDGYALTKDDCGGIYTWSDGKSVHKDRQVVENLIKNGKGVMGGQTWDGSSTQGIYMDDRTDHVVIRGNIIENISESGIFIHNAHDLDIRDNTVYGCAVQFLAIHDSIAPDHPIQKVTVTSNVFAAARPDQLLGRVQNTDDDALPEITFRANSWLSPFLRQGVFSLGAKDQTPVRFFLEDLTRQGGIDPQGHSSSRFTPGISLQGEPGPDLLTDGAFALGTSRWGWWANRDAAMITSSGPGTVRLEFPKPSTHSDSMVLFNSANFNLESGRYYQVSFLARASLPGVVLSFLTRKAGEPWTQSSPEQAWRLDKEFRPLSALVPAWTSEPESRAEFILRQSDLSAVLPPPGRGSLPWVEIQAVEFRPVEAKLTDPQPFIRLFANPGRAGRSQGQEIRESPGPVRFPVPASPGWMDAWGKPASGEVLLAPWTAVVLTSQ